MRTIEQKRRYNREYMRRYYQKNREYIIQLVLESRARNPETLRKYVEKNKEKIRANWRAYYLKNREHILQRTRERYWEQKGETEK